MILLPSETDLTAYRPSAAVAGPLPTFADAFYITIIQRPVHVIGVPSTTFATCDDDYEHSVTQGEVDNVVNSIDSNKTEQKAEETTAGSGAGSMMVKTSTLFAIAGMTLFGYLQNRA